MHQGERRDGGGGGDRPGAAADALYRQLVDRSVQASILMTQAPPRLLHVNNALEELLGISAAVLLAASSEDLLALLHPEDRVNVLARLRARFDGAPISAVSTYRVVRPDGGWVWVEVCGVEIEYQGQPAALFNLLDVTRHMRAEQALRYSERQYRTLAEQSMEGVVVLQGAPLRIVFANESLTGIVGRTREELTALPPERVLEIVHPEDRARALARFAARLAGEPGQGRQEFRLLRPDGSVRWVEAYAAPIEYHGAPALQACYFDVTERRSAEEERLELEARMRHAEKLESLGVLAGGVAHDFNNLLLGLLSNLSVVQDSLAPDGATRERLGIMEGLLHQAADLCSQMLAYAGKGRILVRPLELSRLVGEVTDLARVSLPASTRLVRELLAGLPAVEADRTQLTQVLLNLLTNAAESVGDHGGEIRVRTAVTELDAALLRACEPGHDLTAGPAVVLEVSDTGPGIDPATRARMFEPFFSTKFTGRGLGLAAVRGIVQAHHGALHVRTEAGRGTTVSVLLPVTDQPESRGPVPPTALAVDLPEGLTVLVVDDDQLALESQCLLLEHHGVRVLAASSGLEAVAVFSDRAAEIDAVLLDQAMPGMDGVATFHRLQELRPGIPVVICSGFCEASIIDNIPAPGPAGFLRKPYGAAPLLAALADAVAQRRPPP